MSFGSFRLFCVFVYIAPMCSVILLLYVCAVMMGLQFLGLFKAAGPFFRSSSHCRLLSIPFGFDLRMVGSDLPSLTTGGMFTLWGLAIPPVNIPPHHFLSLCPFLFCVRFFYFFSAMKVKNSNDMMHVHGTFFYLPILAGMLARLSACIFPFQHLCHFSWV